MYLDMFKLALLNIIYQHVYFLFVRLFPFITNIIPAVYMFIFLVTTSSITSSIFISFAFYQKVTHYGQLWLLLATICHYNTRACVYLETLFITLYDNG